MTRTVFLEPAEEEMLGAATHYENQAPGLGQAFLDQVQHTMSRIAQNPRSGGIVQGVIRRGIVHEFPFGILYRVDPQQIVIIAVMHLRRRPGYWENRVTLE